MSERIWNGLRKNALYKSTYTLLYFRRNSLLSVNWTPWNAIFWLRYALLQVETAFCARPLLYSCSRPLTLLVYILIYSFRCQSRRARAVASHLLVVVLTTLLGVLEEFHSMWGLSYMVTQFWNCPAPISDCVITCLEPWAQPLASWQAVIIVVHYSF